MSYIGTGLIGLLKVFKGKVSSELHRVDRPFKGV